MTKVLTLASAALLLCGLSTAQNYDELPKGYTTAVDQIYDYLLLPSGSSLPVHIQYAYDTQDVGVGAANITELTWHRNNYYSNAMPAGSLTTTITMATSPNDPGSMSNTFATNLANLTKQVFTGTINFPDAAKGTGPAPWTHVVKLTTPFVFVQTSGKSLVIDLVTTATTWGNTTLTIDASAPDAGTRTSNPNAQSSCKFSNGKYNNSLSYTTGGLNNNGGTWYVRYGSILPNAPGIMTISAYGVDNKGPWPIPLDLTAIGAPGCSWNVGLELGFWLAVTADASGNAQIPSLTIPGGLGGVSFYDHALFLDKAANAAGLVTTWSSKWYIGTLKGPNANTLYKTVDTSSSPTGSFRTGYGTHVRLTR